nr:protein phosphatase 2C domain-containing protein [Microbacterium ulmi]
MRRRINEDSFIAEAPLFLVADGMGGHHAGEIASAAVIEEFAVFTGRESLAIDDVQAAISRARRRIEALPDGGGAGAGTTLAGVVVAEVGGHGYWLAVNIGDSRTYLLSGSEFEQVSVDHSVVQELIDSGELDPAAAALDARRNVITRAIGGGNTSEADFWLLPAERGDRVLVCSDGLTGELPRERIESILRTEPDPQAAATTLVQEAIAHGGRDNITALVVHALEVRSAPPGSHAALPTVEDDVDGDTRPRARATGGRA